MVSRTAALLVATLLAALAQLATFAPTFLLDPLDLGPRTYSLVTAGFSLVALLVGPVGVALLGTAVDVEFPRDRAALLGTFVLAGLLGYLVAAGGFLAFAPGTTAFDRLWTTVGNVLLRAPGFVVPFALAGFAGAAYSHLGRRGPGRRHSHSLGDSAD
jgi:hypothetical protein